MTSSILIFARLEAENSLTYSYPANCLRETVLPVALRISNITESIILSKRLDLERSMFFNFHLDCPPFD